MSDGGKKTLFHESDVYRRNRLIDAVRLLTVLGGFLFLAPAFLVGNGAPTATYWFFLFLSWAVVILVTGLLSRALRRSSEKPKAEH